MRIIPGNTKLAGFLCSSRQAIRWAATSKDKIIPF